MKILRGLLTFIISFVLVILIVAFSLITTLKDLIQHQLVGEAVRQMVFSNVGEVSSEDMQKLNEVMEYEGANEVIDSIISDYTNSSETGEYYVSDETVDSILDYFVNNEEKLEEISGSEIDIEEFKSPEAHEELKNALNEGFKDINDSTGSTVNDVVSAYGTITSRETQIKLLTIIAVLVALMAVISWSLYKWIKSFGIVLITSGIWVSLIYGAISVLKTALLEALGLKINLDASIVLMYGIGEVAIGIVSLIIYSIINKSCNKKVVVKEEIEVDEEVEETEENNSETEE